jgi:protein-S-isoprenylcysteine O-methyltransferase Ste14
MRDPARSSLPHPGVNLPPPLVLVAGFVAGLALERWGWRVRISSDGWLRAICVLAGWLGIVAGLVIAGWGRAEFLRARTTVMPNRAASRLVMSGPYRYSRNPMYLGLSLLYVGLSLLFNLVWPLVLFPFAVIALVRLVISREERYLADAFGEDYVMYCARVGRWL